MSAGPEGCAPRRAPRARSRPAARAAPPPPSPRPRTGSARAAGEAVREHKHCRADRILRRGVALADEVVEDQARVERPLFVDRHARALADPDARRDAVDRGAQRERAVDEVTRALHAFERVRSKLDGATGARDTENGVEREG